MVHLSLVCLLKNDKNGSFRTATLTSAPSLEKLHDIYHQNIKTLDYMIKFCKKNKISSYRVSSSMFPLSTHPKYQDKTLPILESALQEAKKIDFSGVHLSLHPDQFILLSSLNKEVNASSRYDLNLSAHITSFIPIKLINIHVGSKNKGFTEHKKIFDSEFSKLDNKTKKTIKLGKR